MNEGLISWNVPNIISVILMILIIWIVFGGVGHFVFRTGAKSSPSTGTPFGGTELQNIGV